MTYLYAARNAEGAFVRGAIEAESRRGAIEHLRSRALFVTALSGASDAGSAVARLRTLVPVSRRATIGFMRSLATLAGAGVPLSRALEALRRDCRDRSLVEIVASMEADVRAGTALSQAMERHKTAFPPAWIAMARAGEAGAGLAQALLAIADVAESDRASSKRVATALAYPAIVTCIAAALIVFLVETAVPAFASLFGEMHVAVPVGTRLLIGTGTLLREPIVWVAAAVTIVAALAAARSYAESDAPWARLVDAARFAVPLAGPIVSKSAASRFARSLGALLQAGVNVSRAIDVAGGVVRGYRYRKGLAASYEALQRGETLAAALAESGLFDAAFLQLVRSGEESGAADVMLDRISRAYDADVDSSVAALTAAIEPALIVVIGAVVAGIVCSILLPLYSLIGEIK